METRAAMVEYSLARRGVRAHLQGGSESIVVRVRSYEAGAAEPGTLYVAGPGAAVREFPDDAGYAVLCCDETNRDIVIEAYEVLRELDAWDASLKDALLQGATFEDFMRLGRDMLGCRLAYFDRNLIVLAASDDYWDRGGPFDGAEAGLRVEGQMPFNRAADLVEDVDYLRAAEIHGGFYYEDAHNRMYYGVNTFDRGEYLARLVLILPEGERRLHRGQEQLIDCFHAKLDDLHLRYAGNAGIVSSQNDALHALARRVLLEDARPVREEEAAVLESFGWTPRDDFVAAKLVFFEGIHWNTVSLYLCGLLERAMAGSCAFPVEQQIVWLVNLTRSAHAAEDAERVMQRFTESLVSVLRNYACKAGISDVFDDFNAGRSAYREANFALDVGQARDPHYWYFVFSNYAFDYLVAKCGEDLSPLQVCHPALKALISHDDLNGTEYARTLVCFLRNSQNTTHAADELFIHRTSFMRRMAHMEKLAEFDLGDPDQVLHLLLSAKLLGL